MRGSERWILASIRQYRNEQHASSSRWRPGRKILLWRAFHASLPASLQLGIQILGKEAVHQEALPQVPRPHQVQRKFVVGHFHQLRSIEQVSDPDGDGLVEIEAVDRIAVLLPRQQEAEQAHEQGMSALEVHDLCPSGGNIKLKLIQ